MTSVLLTGIGQLVTNNELYAGTPPCAVPAGRADAESRLGVIPGAAVVVGRGPDGRPVVEWIGVESAAPAADSTRDLGGRCVIPAFVDPHTHLVFAGDRCDEFTARMAGRRYDGGGIARTVATTAAASDVDLRTLLDARVAECRAQGTGTLEIKTGYGLDVVGEARLARLAHHVTPHVTFLGAHVVPRDYADRRQDYIDLVCGPMLDAVCDSPDGPLVSAIDVFCEPHSPHAFTAEEARVVLEAGAARGLTLRVHGNQLGPGPGVQLACEVGAANVDHCTHLDDADVDALAAAAPAAAGATAASGAPRGPAGTAAAASGAPRSPAGTVAVLLPGVEFSTRSPYPNARRLLDAGATVALATDCNPGTCYSTSVPWIVALAVREMRMTPAEALWAATVGGAQALRITDGTGRIAVGGPALLTVLDAPAYGHLSYRPGVPLARLLDLDDAVNG